MRLLDENFPPIHACGLARVDQARGPARGRPSRGESGLLEDGLELELAAERSLSAFTTLKPDMVS